MFTGRAARYAAAGALVVVTVVLVLLFGRAPPPQVVGVVFATEAWPRGAIGELAILDVPESLAPLFVTPDGIGQSVAAFDIPANTFLTAEMLRPPGADLDDGSGLSRLRLPADVTLWPAPGPAAGDEAVIGPAGRACALVVTELLDIGEGTVTFAASPKAAGQVLTGVELAVWPPAAGAWPPCPEAEAAAPVLDTPPGATRLRLLVDLSLWPVPGPAPGAPAVIGRTGEACALVVTELLDAGEGTVTVAADPSIAARLTAVANLSAWPPAAEGWPLCPNPAVPDGSSPMRFLVETTHWPAPGPAAGDLAVIGPPTEGCAWLIAELLDADGPAISLAATPDVAARLMAETALAAWPPTADGTWPFCDLLDEGPAPDETGPEAAGLGERECVEAGGQWNADTRECEGV